MRLHEIEQALKGIIYINKDLNKERLEVLLKAAAWEDGDIRDALIMWQNQTLIPEGELDSDHILPPASLVEKQLENVAPSLQFPQKNNVSLPSRSDAYIPEVSNSTQKPQIDVSIPSFAIEPGLSEKKSYVTNEEELPQNLPLRPYDSAYITVPLKDFEKHFPVKDSVPQNEAPQKNFLPITLKSEYEETKISTLRSHDDKYIVILAVCMFLVLMLLLGYMYSNGRI